MLAHVAGHFCSSLLSHRICHLALPLCLTVFACPPPHLILFLTLKSFSWNSVMSARCYVSHYTSVILHHIARFRCECSTVPSVSSLHISSSISPELLNKLGSKASAICPLMAKQYWISIHVLVHVDLIYLIMISSFLFVLLYPSLL